MASLYVTVLVSKSFTANSIYEVANKVKHPLVTSRESFGEVISISRGIEDDSLWIVRAVVTMKVQENDVDEFKRNIYNPNKFFPFTFVEFLNVEKAVEIPVEAAW